jgi:Glycosyl hydrolases family 18.
MGWNKKSNVAQFGEASWDNFVKKVSGITPQEAMRRAFADPDITFFFYCREYMVLEGPAAMYGPFNPGDAVFFTGKPWYGSAPQCDSYEKTAVSTIYISPADDQQFQNIGCYVLPDGTPAVDTVCLFAGNYAINTVPMLRANNNTPPTQDPFNPNIQSVLSAGLVRYLQDKGITVLLTVMNAHTDTGWDEFTDQTTAQAFADYLKKNVITPLGLDGIDIDDEYSKYQDMHGYYVDPSSLRGKSLAMATTLIKQTMPDKLITKALWSDSGVFEAEWNGCTLGANLSYGWEMNYYGGDANSRLSYYTRCGMKKNQLCLGFSAENRFSDQWNSVEAAAAQTISDGYAGGMMFAYENQPASITVMQSMVNGLDGPGSWNTDSSCKQA